MSANAGSLKFTGSVQGTCAAAATTSCTTVIVGIPAILLEKADDPDPVAIGDTTTYTVKVTNQGTADDSNVQVVVTIAPELVPVSTSAGTISGQTVTLPAVPGWRLNKRSPTRLSPEGLNPATVTRNSRSPPIC